MINAVFPVPFTLFAVESLQPFLRNEPLRYKGCFMCMLSCFFELQLPLLSRHICTEIISTLGLTFDLFRNIQASIVETQKLQYTPNFQVCSQLRALSRLFRTVRPVRRIVVVKDIRFFIRPYTSRSLYFTYVNGLIFHVNILSPTHGKGETAKKSTFKGYPILPLHDQETILTSDIMMAS